MQAFHFLILQVNLDFSAINADAFSVAVVGYSVVFLSLLTLYLVFKNLPRFFQFTLRRRHKKQGNEQAIKESEKEISGEVNAAIGMALYLYFNELHDTEKTILTMKKVSKRYSPWNSKIYNVLNVRS